MPATPHAVAMGDDGSLTVGTHVLLSPARGARAALAASPAPGLPGALVLGLATPDGAASARFDAVLGQLHCKR